MKRKFKCIYAEDKFCNCTICPVDITKNYCKYCIFAKQKRLMLQHKPKLEKSVYNIVSLSDYKILT